MQFVSGSGHIVLMWSAFVRGRPGMTAKWRTFFDFFLGLIVSLASYLSKALP
jgi:hypothetical protein